jgi:hypothetical protein|nr:MAG TPA: hypothetical protein [Caudoviricetes sp.]
MMFFIDHVQTYCNVNQKGKEMNEFIEQFDRYFVCDDCALDALKCELEAKVKELNGKYPKVKEITFSSFRDDCRSGQFSVKVENDDYKPVCSMSYKVVKGFYSFGEGHFALENRQEGGEL